ncbi:polysaccharide biosynthesis protein [Desulfurivibrio alkaliphilus]|uniref:Polysaccharide biosynthesis protein CapD n=1 Tax=Desulfurivibrio alkaliphilus (strain DSM 19089 / UNIQEM U267 / AHT2) TaxID=589865 RepID=D6Z4L2_DESAT|nr:nucleoside-diphosphate sugar epimerase/dehydratase [Desulfurivibrio alkaliphilus]ADH86487.1 polysaccharide biosynthesis protein CapD [Desulfurivibrio alkaliphilus AHT 2]
MRRLNFWLILGADILLLVAAHLLAYGIRFDFEPGAREWANIKAVLPWLVPLKITVFAFFGLYRGMWRYTGVTDLLNILRANFVTGLVIMGGILLATRFEGFSRSVFVLDTILAFLMIAGLRFSIRLFYQGLPRWRDLVVPGNARRRKRLLLIGAGDAAEKVVRETMDNQELPHRVVGFLDDNPDKIGRWIHGIPVYGPIARLRTLALHVKAEELLIAMPSAGREEMEQVVRLCRESKLPFKTLPGLGELISDKVSIKSIRDVSYKDLLGRPPVRLEQERIEEVLRGRTVLVTGAGGSIGSDLCRQIVRFKPARLVMFDADEANLYRIEMEILHEKGFAEYAVVLGKVQDRELLEHMFAEHKPTVVFHAAAYKHVPLVEHNPWEGVYNNIFASKRLMEVAMAYGVERFILVSSDKAVRPTNVMGATKRLAEMLLQAYCRELTAGPEKVATRFMAVRFGNVLGSSGSVIPLFKRQIELGGPVTVTDPEMTRYFMSIEEASQLILQAAAMGEGGEIFILEMGTPVRIGRMARDLIRLCGKEPDSEIEIKQIGLRPGEKMHEELITEGEGIVKTEHEKIMVLRGQGRSFEELRRSLDNLKELASRHDAVGIKTELKKIIPEYTPQGLP